MKPTPTGMTQYKTTKKQMTQRRSLVEMLSLQGLGPVAISESLAKAGVQNCGIETIRTDLRWIDEQWKKQFSDDLQQWKRKAIAAHGQMLARSWDGLARSQKDEVVITTKTYKDLDGKDCVEQTERRRGQAGEARWMGEIRQSWRQLMDLLGLTEIRLSGELTLTGDKQYGGPEAMRALERMLEAGLGGEGMQTIDGVIIESHVAGMTSSDESGGSDK